MSHIVCGRFDRTVDADAALEALKSEGFRREEVDSFYVTPPGQHAELLLGGDAYSDAGARQGGRGAAFGVVAGALIGGIAGFVLNQLLALPYVWVGVLLGAALGAYVGSLAGTITQIARGASSFPTTSSSEDAPVAPWPSASPTASSLKSKATTSWSESRWMRWTMLPPIFPRPTKPSCIRASP